MGVGEGQIIQWVFSSLIKLDINPVDVNFQDMPSGQGWEHVKEKQISRNFDLEQDKYTENR